MLTVLVDDSIAPCIVPATADTECFGLTTFSAEAPIPGATLTIANGGRVRNLGLLENGLLIIGAPTVTTPLYFTSPGLVIRQGGQINNAAGALVAMIDVQAAAFTLALLGFSFLDNSAAPAVPIVGIAPGGVLAWVLIETIEPITATMVQGNATTTLDFYHDSTVVHVPQTLFLGAFSETRVDNAGAANPASGTTAARPVGAFVGQMYFDTTIGSAIWWNGSAWVLPKTQKVQVFTAGGTWVRPANVDAVNVTLVGGGGGGGGVAAVALGTAAGGGGAGGFVQRDVTVTANVAVTIGAGGAGGTVAPTAGTSGTASTFGALLTATGGGGGGGGTGTFPIGFGLAGGCGGGAGNSAAAIIYGGGGGGALSQGQSNRTPNTFERPGKGSQGGNGGFSGVGVLGGDGGLGINGLAGGGGGGSAVLLVQPGLGNSGGGNGGNGAAGAAAVANTGGGGGGAAGVNPSPGFVGGAGGSGICIVTWWE